MSIHDGSECGCCGALNLAGATGFYYCPACRAEDSRLFQAVLEADTRGCEHAAPDGPHICDDCAAADARETERDLEADALAELLR